LSHDEISDYIDKIKFLYEESDDKDFKFFQNQDPMEIDDMWSNYWSKNNNHIKIRYK